MFNMSFIKKKGSMEEPLVKDTHYKDNFHIKGLFLFEKFHCSLELYTYYISESFNLTVSVKFPVHLV